MKAEDEWLMFDHKTDYGYRYKMTLYTKQKYLEFDIIRLCDHKNVFGIHKEYKSTEKAVEIFEKTKADILDINNPAHTSMQQLAEKYYPISKT